MLPANRWKWYSKKNLANITSALKMIKVNITSNKSCRYDCFWYDITRRAHHLLYSSLKFIILIYSWEKTAKPNWEILQNAWPELSKTVKTGQSEKVAELQDQTKEPWWLSAMWYSASDPGTITTLVEKSRSVSKLTILHQQ